MIPDPTLKFLGVQPYLTTYQAMQHFNQSRDADTADEIWLVQHEPVLTLGMNGKRHHILQQTNIPVVETDRGGQVTYHGPGQLMMYVLIDIKRRRLGVRDLVSLLENTAIELLKHYEIQAVAKKDAPGVYVDGKKIASVGLRIKRHSSYHGISFNVDMDLSPFKGINPCGYEALEMTQLSELKHPISMATIETQLSEIFIGLLKS
ncbi:MAG: lipoyl(octanoyl) transferase LipB [Methylococcales bacterium]|jgi:lipoyl(octanoyl) transferase|nr:lipoyl(octanoyl) transferase LipB [Methylococcales bacterium]MBT7442464.1 lipoyl(octanoyl) transferase LipB [Methylococcales bacterium]